MNEVVIVPITADKVNQPIVDALNGLYAEVDPQVEPLSWAKTADIAGRNWLFAATCDERIVGMVILVAHRVRRGYIGCIEELAVTADVRGQGIEAKLLGRCVEQMKSVGGRSVAFTCSPHNKDIQRVAPALGFSFSSVVELSNVFDRKMRPME